MNVPIPPLVNVMMPVGVVGLVLVSVIVAVHDVIWLASIVLGVQLTVVDSWTWPVMFTTVTPLLAP